MELGVSDEIIIKGQATFPVKGLMHGLSKLSSKGQMSQGRNPL